MNLVTGKKSSAHVSSDDFRKIVESLVGGGGSYVSSVGTELQTSVSGTTLSIGKGMIVHHGCVFETSNSGDTVSFQAGSSGMNRIDLICVKYTRNNTTGIENAVWYVLQGTSTSGTPVQPTVPSGDLRDENATQDYCPVFKLTLTGNTPTVQLLLNPIPLDDAYHKPLNGIPKSDLVNAVQSSLNLADSSVQIDLLWENGEPSSSFSGKPVSVSGSGYDFYLVTFKEKTDSTRLMHSLFNVGMGTRVERNDDEISYSENHRRTATSTTSSITFSDGYYVRLNAAAQTDNACCIPYKIYGIKGVS